MFFKALVQAVLIFGSETWVLTPRMGRALGIFQQRVTRRIMGRHTKRKDEGGWEYTRLLAVIEEGRFE